MKDILKIGGIYLGTTIVTALATMKILSKKSRG